MKAVRWSRLALRDLSVVNDHYADIAPDYVRRVEQAVSASCLLLLESPLAGTPLGPRGTRKWSVPRIPYVLLYQPTANGILIVRIHHARQNWRAL